MKSKLGILGLIAAAGIMSGFEGHFGQRKRTVNVKNIDPKPRVVLPKGCKEYFFNYLGDFINKNDGVYVFKCFAISDKSAIKKFKKWAKVQN